MNVAEVIEVSTDRGPQNPGTAIGSNSLFEELVGLEAPAHMTAKNAPASLQRAHGARDLTVVIEVRSDRSSAEPSTAIDSHSLPEELIVLTAPVHNAERCWQRTRTRRGRSQSVDVGRLLLIVHGRREVALFPVAVGRRWSLCAARLGWRRARARGVVSESCRGGRYPVTTASIVELLRTKLQAYPQWFVRMRSGDENSKGARHA